MSTTPVDLGLDYDYEFTRWDPDLALNPHYQHLAHLLPVERYGAIVGHPDKVGRCRSGITFDGEAARAVEPDRPRWTVEAWDPLSISPSLLCRACGDHGFIREGRWVQA